MRRRMRHGLSQEQAYAQTLSFDLLAHRRGTLQRHRLRKGHDRAWNPQLSMSQTGSLTTPRDLHTATLLNNGKVLVAGGIGPTTFPLVAELFDPASGTFTATGSLGAVRHSATATLLKNGKVLVAGGKGAPGT